MKANKPYRFFMIAWGAMIFLTIAAAHATQIGVVNFANGSTTPTSISKSLLTQAKAATKSPGQVVLLRAGASPIGGRAFNFVLSGERAAAVRNALVAAGIPRRKIVSQFVGIVSRGTAAQDRQVIVDATTRQALAHGGHEAATPTGQGQRAALNRLEAQVASLEAAAHKSMPKAVPVKAKARPFYTGSAWYTTRTMAENSFAPGYNGASTAGDNYQSSGYGFALHTRRPVAFNFWTPYSIPLQFSLAGMSQKWQVSNPVLQGTENVILGFNTILFAPLNTRDAVSTEFLHGSIKSPWNLWGVTFTPGIKIGWLGEQSLSGGETSQWMSPTCTTQGCPTITTASTSAAGGSAISVTPSLAISGQGWKIGYSQSPWGGYGYNAPRVLMGTVHGRGVSLSLGAAFPDCQICAANDASITMGKIVKLGVRGDGWGGGLIYVGGEKFESFGAVLPGTLMQALAPYNPARPWNSYNPGLTISLEKRLTPGLWAQASYNYESETGGGYMFSMETAVTKSAELSLRGRF
ncbi:MAG: hypothetical protein M0Z85_05955 [Gammaproteobacteria bacterium]|nr:hypothetical protein [Gammaproteobacteria bacterium]